jgi:hypothetical protein
MTSSFQQQFRTQQIHATKKQKEPNLKIIVSHHILLNRGRKQMLEVWWASSKEKLP